MEVFVLVVIAVISSILIYNKYGNTKKIILSDDEIKFKKEYEELNATKDKDGKKYNTVFIKENNGVVYTSIEKLDELLKKDAVIYFGNSKNRKSRNVVSIILDSADSTGIEQIYYISVNDDLSLDNKNQILKLLNIDKFDIPFVIFVSDGKIIGSVTTEADELNEIDKNRIASEYMKYMSQVSSGVCDEKC